VIAFPARYIVYGGGLLAVWISARRRKRAATEPRPPAGTGAPSRLLARSRALQEGLRQVLLGAPAAADDPAGAELRRSAAHFRTSVREDFEPSPMGRDSRAAHFVRRVLDALPETLDAGDPQLRPRLHATHEAAIDLIEFLQVELGTGSRLAVADLRLDPRYTTAPADASCDPGEAEG